MKVKAQVDLIGGLLRIPVPGTCYLVTSLLDDPLVAAVPREHPLSRSQGLHLRQLATEPLVLFHRSHGPGIYDAITRACDAACFTPTPVHEADEMQTILSYVAGGLGVSLVPCSLAQFHRPDIAYLPLKSPRAVLTLAAVTQQGPPKQHVLNFLATAKTIGGQWKKRLPSLLGIRDES